MPSLPAAARGQAEQKRTTQRRRKLQELQVQDLRVTSPSTWRSWVEA